MKTILLCLFVVGILRAAKAGPVGLSASPEQPGALPAVTWDMFIGEWSAQPDAPQIVEVAIRKVTESMNFFAREIARQQLGRRFAPPASIRIARQGDTLLIAFAGASPQALPLSGAEVRQGSLRLRVRLEAGVLRHTGVAPDGQRENLFRLRDNAGTLEMETTAASPKLPGPLQFSLAFHRAASPVAPGTNW